MINPFIYRCSLHNSVLFYIYLIFSWLSVLYKKLESLVVVAVVAIAFSVFIFVYAVICATSLRQLVTNVLCVLALICFIMHLVNEMFKSWRGI